MRKYRQDRTEVPFPKGAYSTNPFADKLIGFLGEPASREKPFFAYLAFSAPHWPLQAPDADITKYKGRFDAGPEALRAARLDRNVGRVIDALRASGQLDNTLILFTADNGPECNEIAASKQMTDPVAIRKLGIDNSLANIGRGSSYVGYGFGWAHAGLAPSWLVKGYTTEGGTRTVTFASGKGVVGGRVGAVLLAAGASVQLGAAAATSRPCHAGDGQALVPAGRASLGSDGDEAPGETVTLPPVVRIAIACSRALDSGVRWPCHGEQLARRLPARRYQGRRLCRTGASRLLRREYLGPQRHGRQRVGMDAGRRGWRRAARHQGRLVPARGRLLRKLPPRPAAWQAQDYDLAPTISGSERYGRSASNELGIMPLDGSASDADRQRVLEASREGR